MVLMSIMNPTRGARGPVTRYLGYLAAFLGVWIGSGCVAYYPKIGRAAKPVPSDEAVGEWKNPKLNLDLLCERVKSARPEYRLTDGRFWQRFWHPGEPDSVLLFYKIRNQGWFETFARHGYASPGNPIDDSVSVGIFRFDGPDRVYVRYLDSNWLYDYVNSHPKVLSYLTRQEKPNSVPEVIITASPERWYWFLENKVRYPKSFYGPVTLFRAR
jgi:hypothetical protein